MTHAPSRRIVWFFVAALVATAVRAPFMQASGASGPHVEGFAQGPWENSPYNPVIRTVSNDERWWSKGHATLVEGPDNVAYDFLSLRPSAPSSSASSTKSQ